MERDEEEERILKRKLQELSRKKAAIEQRQTGLGPAPQPTKKTPRQILLERLVDRGDEVLLAAESQYPYETAVITEKLAELITSNQIVELIRGGDLLSLFRALGINVSVETSIRIKKDGRAVSIADKLREEKSQA